MEVLASASCPWVLAGRSSSRRSHSGWARGRRAPSPAAPPGCISRCALSGVEEGDEVMTEPVLVRGLANRRVYEGASPVFADIDPATLNLDPEAAAAAIRPRTSALLPVHIFGYPADMPALERLAARRDWGSSRTPARRSARSTPTARGRRSRQPGGLRLLREQAADDGRGRDGDAGAAAQNGSTPSATRGAPPTWAGSTTIGSASTTGSRTSRARWASCSSRGSTRCSRPGHSGRALPRGARGHGGIGLPCPNATATSAAGSCSSSRSPREIDRDGRRRGPRASAASRASRICRRST